MRRPLLLFSLATALTLAVPAVAAAGGFATAGLSSTPDGLAPGKPWKVDITVLQHGVTPVDGLTPKVQISSVSGDAFREFPAKPTGKSGVYRAVVVFPKAGEWDYRVLDGFNDQMPHTFPAVRIGDGAAAPAAPPPDPAPVSAPVSGGDGIAAGWLWGAGLTLLLALVVLLADRERRHRGGASGGRDGVRAATAVAGALACAAAAMAAAAFVVGDDDGERAASAPEPAPASAAARDGKAVWVANGCGSCHTFLPANARAPFGPNLAATLKGMPASYIRESIVNPGAVAAAGWEGGMMPEDFGARIPPEELDALVEFIRSGVRD